MANLSPRVVGGWIIAGAYFRTSGKSESVSVDLQGAHEVSLKLNHGAGRLNVTGGASTGKALEGECTEGVRVDAQLSGDRLEVRVGADAVAVPFIGMNRGLNWTLRLSNEVPFTLDLETGANQSVVDLREVRVTRLNVQTAASSTDITLPASGHVTAEARVGAARRCVCRKVGDVSARSLAWPRLTHGIDPVFERRVRVAGLGSTQPWISPSKPGGQSQCGRGVAMKRIDLPFLLALRLSCWAGCSFCKIAGCRRYLLGHGVPGDQGVLLISYFSGGRPFRLVLAGIGNDHLQIARAIWRRDLLGGIGLAFWPISRRQERWALIPAGVLTTLAVVTFLPDLVGTDSTPGIFFLGLALTFALVAWRACVGPGIRRGAG
jgi:hypothetical protein